MSFKLVEQAIDCYLRSSELKNCIVSYDDEDGNKEQNFLSTVKKVTLTGYKNSDVPIVMKVFVKTLTESEERNERLKLRIKFSREAFVYNEIVPIFEVIQKDLDEPEKLYFPKCHSASEAYLILEDISNSGFKDIDHFKPVDDITHMVMMVQNIARWHSLSFVLKQKEPLKFTRLTESLDTIFVTKDRAEFVYGNSWNKALAIISNEGIKTYLSNIKDEMIQRSISLPHPGEIGVVCHGDINLRNALFKYDEKNLPKKMMLIDFQLAHHSSPVTDLTFLIFSSTCRKFRDDQYPRLVEIYYKSLETHLKLFGFSMDHCYPRRTIEKHFVEYLPYCLTTLFTVTRVMCATCFGQDQLNKLYKSSGRGSLFDCYTEEAEKEYAIRINEIVEDFVKYGYLKI